MQKRRPIFITALTLITAILMSAASASDAPTPGACSEEQITLPIIMYHEIKNNNLGKDVISPYEFESDLKYLKKQHYTTITMTDLIGYVTKGARLPDNPVILTFDDGYLSNYIYALPLLKKYDMKIVLSLIVKDTDNFSRIPDDNVDYSHVTWRQLNEMLDSGLVEVQNHSYSLHANKNGRYGCIRKAGETPVKFEELVKKDILKAQDKIFMMTGCLPSTFAYPYGRYCEETDIILRKLGFQATLSCRYGINVVSRSNPGGLFRLKRICRSHNATLGCLLDEAYKTIRKKMPSL